MNHEHSHILGGSTAAQRVNCPGSLSLEAQMPAGPASEFALQGSVFHAAMELLLTANPTNMDDAEPLLDQLVGQDLGFGDDWKITDEQIEAKIEPALTAWFEVTDKYELDDWFIEQRVSLEEIVPGAFGTADIIAKDTSARLHVLDWKFGDGVPVPAKGNLGLGFYAASALYDPDPELAEFCADIEGVVLHIVQPRVGFDQVLDTWETDEDWIESFIDLIVPAMARAQQPNPPVKTGPWCRWCAAKPICPAYKKLASEALGASPASMSGVDLAAALTKADLLKAWITDVFALAQREMEQGAAVPGFKLVKKLPRRIWKDDKAAEKALRANKIKVADMFKRTIISPTQFEKLDKELYSSLEADHVILHSSGLTVVPDSDRREAVTSSMELLANALPGEGKKKGKGKK